MQIKELKTGFRGYRKESVYRYIASLEEDFSRKLLEKDSQSAKTTAQFEQRIEELETELRALKKENEEQRNRQMMIANTLLEAQAYAARLQAETLRQEQEAQKLIEEEAQKQYQELEGYGKKVKDIRDSFASLLKELDREAEKFEQRAEAL